MEHSTSAPNDRVLRTAQIAKLIFNHPSVVLTADVFRYFLSIKTRGNEIRQGLVIVRNILSGQVLLQLSTRGPPSLRPRHEIKQIGELSGLHRLQRRRAPEPKVSMSSIAGLLRLGIALSSWTSESPSREYVYEWSIPLLTKAQ